MGGVDVITYKYSPVGTVPWSQPKKKLFPLTIRSTRVELHLHTRTLSILFHWDGLYLFLWLIPYLSTYSTRTWDWAWVKPERFSIID